ncbi:phage tail protein [Citrobacter portucalensis]|uniref:phage tail protein n=1 Tax=Citrobacter portucalensis TaxID=1639133 RepID=UPI00226B42FF|nr:phage tail protein [Citrobacter portucalensis]MCX9065054.1 phage tail protein [Citrobacter portucalensis]
MHRIDTPTAQKDKFGAGKNGFTRGNPQTGTPATDLDDDYFDMLQEELAGVVEASGVNLEKSKHNQLLTALKALLLSRAHPFADIKADGAAAIAEALSNLGLTNFADKGASSEQLFNGVVVSKKGVSATSTDGKRRVNLFVSDTGYELIVYIDGKYNNAIQIPTKYGTMALLDDVSNSVQSAPPPIGIPFFWPVSAMPNTVVPEWSSNVFLKMNDATFSASTYPKLALVWPGLKLTDCRGEFLRIWDDGRGVDSGRALLSAQGDAIRNITGSIGFAADGLFTFVNGAFKPGPVSNTNRVNSVSGSGSYAYATLDVSSSNVPTASENRPRNVAFNLLVRAK